MPGNAFLAGITEHHVVKQEGESAMSNPRLARYGKLQRINAGESRLLLPRTNCRS
jgi:hypothetical protein